MDEQAETRSFDVSELTVGLVSAYVSNNRVSLTELPAVIASVHAALSGLGNGVPVEAAGPEKPTAAQIRKSITPDLITSFIDGNRYKILKRHLTRNGLTMETYRERYGLPADYPSTSSAYSAQRSDLARSIGLGQQGRKAAANAAATVETISEMPRTRGRPRKAVESPKTDPKPRGRKKIAGSA